MSNNSEPTILMKVKYDHCFDCRKLTQDRKGPCCSRRVDVLCTVGLKILKTDADLVDQTYF